MHNAMPKIIERSGVVIFSFAATLVSSACHLGGQSFDDGRDGLGGVRTQREHGGKADAGVTTDAAELGVSPSASVSPTDDSTVGQLCALPPVDRIVAESYEELQARVQGRWMRCSGPGAFDGEFLDGIDINADGSWSLLRFDEAGQLQSQTSLVGERTWVIVNRAEGNDEFELRLGQANTAMVFNTTFGNDSMLMLLHPTDSIGLTTGDGAGDYQLLTEPVWQPDTVTADAGSALDATGAEACAFEEDAEWIREIIEQQVYTQHLMGRWVYCSGAVNVAPQDGIEMRADGTWALLRRDEAGALVWQDAPELSGSWSVIDVTGAGGQFEFLLKTTAGGFYTTSLGFSENPALMHMDSPEGGTLFARE